MALRLRRVLMDNQVEDELTREKGLRMANVFTLRELMDKQFDPPAAEGFVYAIYDASRSGLIKIGRSKDPWGRLERLSRELGRELELVDYWPTDDCVRAEAAAHEMLANSRVYGEWFYLPPGGVKRRQIEAVGQLVARLDPGGAHAWHCDCGECS